ncbi:hypothetical protein NOVO_02820 [Rickettsiales bacterium Ac37b]|nr:hypothetical protein NOVO_02820 [Rickettsiales bacterium Ac37b]
MVSDKRLIKLLKRAKKISQLYIELLQKSGSKIENNSRKIDLLKSKRNKAISNLEIPFILAISNQDNQSRDWRELLSNNAEFFTENATKYSKKSKSDFIDRILVHSNELRAFKENLKEKLFVKGAHGKNQLAYDDKKIDDLIKLITNSVAEKILKIDKTKGNLDRFIDMVTIEKVNNCLVMELEKHNSQNNIMYKINNIIQKRYKEYKRAYTNAPDLVDVHKEKQNIETDLRSNIQKTKSMPVLKDIEQGITELDKVKKNKIVKARDKALPSVVEENKKSATATIKRPKSLLALKNAEQDSADPDKVKKNKTVKARGKAMSSAVEENKKSATAMIKRPKIKPSSKLSYPKKRGFLEDFIADLQNDKRHQVKQSSDIIPARVKKEVKEVKTVDNQNKRIRSK